MSNTPILPVSVSDPPIIGDVCCINSLGYLVPLHYRPFSLPTKAIRTVGRLLHLHALQHFHDPPPAIGIYLGNGRVTTFAQFTMPSTTPTSGG